MQSKQSLYGTPLPVDKYRQYYSEFIELAAHDLQSPLRKLQALTQSLVEKYKLEAPEEAQDYVRRIEGSIGQLRSLVEDMRLMALTTSEEMDTGIVDIDQIVRRLVLEISYRTNEDRSEIEIGSLPSVCGDKKQLELMFRKVLENCFKFRKKNIPVRIKVSAEKLNDTEREKLRLRENNYQKIVVTDNGIGFDDRDKKKIFEPLVRLHGKSTFQGNGLGLAMVERIANNHGGIVFAEGNRAEGAKIVIIIPENQD
jgi:signal transduction histidine kinase